MCYKKPGPRCSSHAQAILEKAKQSYLSDPTYDNYAKMRDAEEEFMLTPKGQRQLANRIEEATSYEEKYDLSRKLNHYKEVRKLRIAEVAVRDEGDVNDGVHGGVRDVQGATFHEGYGYVKDGLPVDPMKQGGLVRGFDGMAGLEHDFDYYGCTGEHDYGDICRDSEFQGLRLSPISNAEYLRQVFQLPEGAEVPSDWVRKLESIDGVSENVDVEARRNYYGEDAYINPTTELQRTVAGIFDSLPNAEDHNGAFGYLRSRGINNSGVSPLQALKSLEDVNRIRVGGSTRDAIRRADHVDSRTLKFDQVDISGMRQSRGDSPYEFPKRMPKGVKKPFAGVVVKDANGKYTLIDGTDTFIAAENTGQKSWKFLVIEKKPEPENRWSRWNRPAWGTPGNEFTR